MKTLLHTLLFSFFSFMIYGQETRVITFGDDDKEDYVYKVNIIKTSPTSFLFGRQPIEYERELTDFLSVQGGLGFTFLSALSGLSAGWYSDFVQDENTDLLDNSIREGSVGIILSFSPRLWFDSDGMDGSYIAPVVRYSTYNSEVQQAIPGQTILERNPNAFDSVNSKNVDLVVHYGYQSLSDVITWECFVGLGIRNQTGMEQDITRMNGVYQNGVTDIERKQILVELGLRFGFRL